MAIQSNFPSIRPSLLLDFANSKRLDPRVTFTRASTATYYDGVTVSKAEENLLTYSQAFDETAWTKNATTVTADQTTAPDGTSTADLLASAATTATHSVTRNSNISITSGLTYVFSVFLKKGSGATAPDIMQLAFSTGSSVFSATAYSNFNINTGTVGTTGAGATASIVDAGGGWYRCTIIATATASVSGSAAALIAFTNNNDALGRVPNYAALATDDVFVWGAQLEQRSALTAYTATTTQAITNYVPKLQTAAAGVARFDHNPVTGESLGLLVEESRVNRALRSDDFDNAAWTKTRSSIVSNTIVAPDGSLTGDKLIDTTDNNTHFTTQTFTGTAASYSYTVYAKAGERTFIALRLFNGTSQVGLAYYNLGTGATGTVSSGTAAITSVGNGWYRCSLVATLAASASCTADIRLASADNTNSYAGDGYAGAFIWGAQVELGAFATSYIPTISATVTRSEDAASMTGTNFSSWYNASEGTLYADGIAPDTFGPMTITSGASTNAIELRNRASGVTSTPASVLVNNVQQWSGTLTFANENRVAFAYKVNDSAAAVNGTASATITSILIPVVSQVQFGFVAGTMRTGRIRKLAYYPLRLTDANLAALTG